MKNNKIDRKRVLNVLIQHETLTGDDLANKEYLGIEPDAVHLRFLLQELQDEGYIQDLAGVKPVTYTITKTGIDEGLRLRRLDEPLRKT